MPDGSCSTSDMRSPTAAVLVICVVLSRTLAVCVGAMNCHPADLQNGKVPSLSFGMRPGATADVFPIQQLLRKTQKDPLASRTGPRVPYTAEASHGHCRWSWKNRGAVGPLPIIAGKRSPRPSSANKPGYATSKACNVPKAPDNLPARLDSPGARDLLSTKRRALSPQTVADTDSCESETDTPKCAIRRSKSSTCFSSMSLISPDPHPWSPSLTDDNNAKYLPDQVLMLPAGLGSDTEAESDLSTIDSDGDGQRSDFRFVHRSDCDDSDAAAAVPVFQLSHTGLNEFSPLPGSDDALHTKHDDDSGPESELQPIHRSHSESNVRSLRRLYERSHSSPPPDLLFPFGRMTKSPIKADGDQRQVSRAISPPPSPLRSPTAIPFPPDVPALSCPPTPLPAPLSFAEAAPEASIPGSPSPSSATRTAKVSTLRSCLVGATYAAVIATGPVLNVVNMWRSWKIDKMAPAHQPVRSLLSPLKAAVVGGVVLAATAAVVHSRKSSRHRRGDGPAAVAQLSYKRLRSTNDGLNIASIVSPAIGIVVIGSAVYVACVVRRRNLKIVLHVSDSETVSPDIPVDT
ncbi:unnamed protein product (mitochondrion) [Plasmodiophora brassicae]|uniref:Uncharacterized protein n=1 Tax=Plasmodiophora brassicae TaxID=37360 RepID=A0A3P3YF30_PLABS|nr:unnamed protein product [Plasmodiophora brassicae]